MKGFIPSIKPKVVRIKRKLWFAGMTIYPFIFLCPEALERTEAHERIHYAQQDKWWKWAGPLALLVWYFLYLCFLPVGWNPFRWKWEYEAFSKGSGFDDQRIRYLLTRKEGLYKLWWM